METSEQGRIDLEADIRSKNTVETAIDTSKKGGTWQALAAVSISPHWELARPPVESDQSED